MTLESSLSLLNLYYFDVFSTLEARDNNNMMAATPHISHYEEDKDPVVSSSIVSTKRVYFPEEYEDSPPAAALDQYGTLHPTLQQFDRTSTRSLSSEILREHQLIDGVDPGDIRTWFAPSDLPVFHTPPHMHLMPDEEEAPYPCLTYRQLHAHADACPPFWTRGISNIRTINTDFFAVGILLPLDMMTEMAVVHLCIMSADGCCCSAPLDPRSSRRNLLLALDQMGCRGLVATTAMIEKFNLGFLLAKNAGEEECSDENTSGSNDMTGLTLELELGELERTLVARIVDVRVVVSGKDKDGMRDGSVL